VGGAYVGVDAHRKGWVAIVLDSSGFVEAHTFAHIAELADGLSAAEVIAVDIPIGISNEYPRQADIAAREFVGRRRSSVFLTPPMPVLRASDYTAARRTAREQFDIGVSAQAYALAPKILEVDHVAKTDSRIIEVHPEACFTAMGGKEVEWSKTTWAGMTARARLLEANGISIPDDLGPAGVAKPDDVFDAAAAAWTARRYAQETANSLPSASRSRDSKASVIWY
jgi:predicted RNase H-like nuclease